MHENNTKALAKNMKEYMGGYRKYSMLSFVFTLIQQSLWLVIPLVMKQMIDLDIPSKDISGFLVHLSIITLIPIFIMGLGVIYQHIFMKGVWKISLSLKEEMVEKIIHQPMQYFNTKKSGELLNLTSTDLSKFVLYWVLDVPVFYARGLIAIMIFSYLLMIDYRLALINLLAIPLLIYPAKYLIKRVMTLAQGVFGLNRDTKVLLTDVFDKSFFIKSYNLEDKMLKELKDINEGLTKKWSTISALDYLSGSISEQLVHPVFYGLGFSMGAYFIMQGDMSLGTLIAVLGYLPRLYSTMGMLLNNNFKLGRQSTEMEEILKILTLDGKKDGHTELQADQDQIIACENVTFAYDGGNNILENISFDLVKGEIVQVLGKNGAGKSTILHLLTGMNPVGQGDIKFYGESYRNLDKKVLRENIHVLSQTPVFLSRSVKDNFMLVNESINESDIKLLIERVGLSHIFKDREGINHKLSDEFFNLSGGEKQRLSLALALSKNAQVLLLDEIDANIDADSKELIASIIKDYVKDSGGACMIISHQDTFENIVNRKIEW